MSFPQTANVGVKLSAYERTLLVPSSKHGSIVTAGWEVFGEHLYYNNQAFTTWGVQKAIFGDTTARCANEGLEIHSSTSYGIVLSPLSKLEGTWFILFLWPLHPALQNSFLLKFSWRLEYNWGKKIFCFLTFKWNETRNLINSSFLAVMYEHKDKAKISIKSHHVLRGFEFVPSINGKEKNILFLKVQGVFWWVFFLVFLPMEPEY